MLPSLPSPEIFFGICAPVGVDTRKVHTLLSEALKKYEYDAAYFKVTDLMKSVKPAGSSVTESPLEDRYDSYINYANKLREVFGLNYALSMFCCAAARNFRRQLEDDVDKPVKHQAYVFDQFKRKEELDLLRQIYGRLFIVVSVYSERETRLQNLVNRIASDHSEARLADEHKVIASKLMQRDQAEEGLDYGQGLEDAFPTADLFIDIDDQPSAEKLIRRFLDAFFGSNAMSPTHDEYGMYLARTTSLRSVDLSRQVGAAVFSPTHEVLSLGCNEVPKPLGGTYWTDDEGDARDIQKGFDSNERIKRSLLVDFTKRLKENGFLKGETKEIDVARFIVTETSRGGKLRDAQLMDLLEFGRMIHAEMSAICDAARGGHSIRGATLYCTTFPCHMCAKHIIAAGVKRVVYIEPYPKSYAEQLHHDAIIVGRSKSEDKVVFEPFIGISPHRYRDLFARDKRRKQDDGTFKPWIEDGPQPIVRFTVATYLSNEAAVIGLLNEIIQKKKSEGLLDIIRPVEESANNTSTDAISAAAEPQQ
jgi:deoxycytidylate deaminase